SRTPAVCPGEVWHPPDFFRVPDAAGHPAPRFRRLQSWKCTASSTHSRTVYFSWQSKLPSAPFVGCETLTFVRSSAVLHAAKRKVADSIPGPDRDGWVPISEVSLAEWWARSAVIPFLELRFKPSLLVAAQARHSWKSVVRLLTRSAYAQTPIFQRWLIARL